MAFFDFYGVSINGEYLTPSNITKFGLNKKYKSIIADIYYSGKDGPMILHIKRPDLYAKDNEYLLEKDYHLKRPEVCWDEGDLKEEIEYIKARLPRAHFKPF